MVRMLLIGGGSAGRFGDTLTGGVGGGSAAVTQWIGPAIFIPDELRINIGSGGVNGGNGTATTVVWQGPRAAAGYVLLTANGSSTTGGAVSTNNFFGASGIFTSIAGQAGAAVDGNITGSTTTFLSGGAGGASAVTNAGGGVNCNYGYPVIAGGVGTTGGVGRDGYFLTQPIMIGTGGSGGGGNSTAAGGVGGRGGIGCGGGGGGIGTTAGGAGGNGGDGAVFIWSW
jgi:hypothetical protein